MEGNPSLSLASLNLLEEGFSQGRNNQAHRESPWIDDV